MSSFSFEDEFSNSFYWASLSLTRHLSILNSLEARQGKGRGCLEWLPGLSGRFSDLCWLLSSAEQVRHIAVMPATGRHVKGIRTLLLPPCPEKGKSNNL